MLDQDEAKCGEVQDKIVSLDGYALPALRVGVHCVQQPKHKTCFLGEL